MKRHAKKIYFGCGILTIILLGAIAALMVMTNLKAIAADPAKYDAYGIPSVNINLNNTTLDHINSNKFIAHAGNTINLFHADTESSINDIEIRTRGNSTSLPDKKPYQIKLPQKNSLLGLARAKKWILLANSYDHSYIRNDLAFYIARAIGMEYAPSGRFINLYINSEYHGIYYLTPKVAISRELVNLKDPLGVLVELDTLHEDEDKPHYTSSEGVVFAIQDSVSKEGSEALNMGMEDFLKTFNQLELASKNREFEKVSELIDVDSFAKYFIVNELSSNPDAYSSSCFMYKDGPNDKIHAGPVWDFDLAFANHRWGWVQNPMIYSPAKETARRIEAFGGDGDKIIADRFISRFMYYLLDIPEFKNRISAIFQETISNKYDKLQDYINQKIQLIKPSITADQHRWGNNTFSAEIEYLKNWISERYAYFEATYGSTQQP